MDPNKKKTVSRYLRGDRKRQQREDNDRLAAARRKAQGDPSRKAPRRARHVEVDPDDWDELDAFEKIRSQPSRGAAAPRAPGDATAAEPDAVVIAVHAAGRVELLRNDRRIAAELAPSIRSAGEGIVIGDRVAVEIQVDGFHRVVGLGRRETVLARPDPANHNRPKVLAANVDVAVVTLSVHSPPLRPALIDRFVVALAGSGGIAPLIVVNKIDLASDPELAHVEDVLAPHRAAGHAALVASAATGAGIDELRAALRGKTCAFVGHSGVGKSSLLNALDPDGDRIVGDVRARDGRGRHTTTSSSLRELADGTRVIDTPGVREFGLWKIDATTIRAAFPDIGQLARGCRYRDCGHGDEPDCAVREAVEAGDLPADRLASLRRLLESP